MKIDHRFSFFIFQLAEEMNDPKIHALSPISIVYACNKGNRRRLHAGNYKIPSRLNIHSNVIHVILIVDRLEPLRDARDELCKQTQGSVLICYRVLFSRWV